MTTLVTGGLGMVGKALRRLHPEFEYVGSDSGDLRDRDGAKGAMQLFRSRAPARVIHLAARVGGVAANMRAQGVFFDDNIRINTNVLDCAREAGVTKLVALLSTCVYPDAAYVKYPLTEDQLHNGPPHPSNFAYAYAKRMVDVQVRAYRAQYGCGFITAIPNNLYGEHDNYVQGDSHVIPALVRRIWEARLRDEPAVKVWGAPGTRREFTYAQDIGHALAWLLEHYDGAEPVNIGDTEEHTIGALAEMIQGYLGYTGRLVFDDTAPVGQARKPSSTARLRALGYDRAFTPLEEGLRATCAWFTTEYPRVRGVAS